MERLGLENKIAFTAPTGVAACNIRGLTIHSWAGIGKASEPLEQLIGIVMRNSNACKRWRETDILVIDEISMLSAEIFDKLDIIGRRIRNKIQPFGGLQLILCGDFFQLPPVGLNGETIKFCFQANAWTELFGNLDHSYHHDQQQREEELEVETVDNEMIILQKVFRQKDDITFLTILHELREGQISMTTRTILTNKVMEAQKQIQQQQQQQSENETATSLSLSSSSKKLKVRPTKLFSTNEDVDTYNLRELEQLTSTSSSSSSSMTNKSSKKETVEQQQQQQQQQQEEEAKIYFAIDEGKEPYLNQLKNGTKAPAKLHLKIGAQVMLLKNLSTETGLVNGARGTVIGFERANARTDFCLWLPVVLFSVIFGDSRHEERVTVMPDIWDIKLGDA
jgi:ATP-dependent DNA helicase PIF1